MLWIASSSLYINFRNRKLMYKAWLPYNYYSSTILFYLTSAHQMLSMTISMFVNIGCDTLICGLLVHICCQIEILTYRLRNIIFCSDVLRICLHQHYHIFRFALLVNEKFRVTIAIQIILSTMMICLSLYQISKTTVKASFIQFILIIICVLTQIFFYCWYGNEVKIKSYQIIDDIFEMEWLTLDNNIKKSLIIMMMRALVPIQINCAYVIPMNLDSFMNVSTDIKS
ncbi:PREDICTED: odorant receptor 46a-like [Cyphomyrmex costatus]|uniref:odorant receptor 46a-like n=1 Tax=Cyphomyrmex costatus TaxID=456900 RepID=UPI0008524150|nr:PREDICTED: odorant receptor 46a-like [Cyphomyrmex costatus]